MCSVLVVGSVSGSSLSSYHLIVCLNIEAPSKNVQYDSTGTPDNAHLVLMHVRCCRVWDVNKASQDVCYII